jgi:hypothetical protein
MAQFLLEEAMKFIAGTGFRQGKDWGFWFRIFGYGLAVSTLQPLFSERNGYRRTFRIFGIKIEALAP